MAEILSSTDEVEFHDPVASIADFELAFLATTLVFGFFLLWSCAISSHRSTSQPTRYVYSGDTVATNDDELEECEEENNKPTKRKILKESIPPSEIICANGNDGGSDDASIASVAIKITRSCSQLEGDDFDSPV